MLANHLLQRGTRRANSVFRSNSPAYVRRAPSVDWVLEHASQVTHGTPDCVLLPWNRAADKSLDPTRIIRSWANGTTTTSRPHRLSSRTNPTLMNDGCCSREDCGVRDIINREHVPQAQSRSDGCVFANHENCSAPEPCRRFDAGVVERAGGHHRRRPEGKDDRR